MSLNLESLGPDICLSGGAEGADLQFGMVCGIAGMTVIHWSFKKHKTNAPAQEVVLLDESQLKDADALLKQASLKLKKYFPPKSIYVRNLLRRNYYQVAWSDSVYAVATIKGGLVQGGTGWAVEIFKNRFANMACPCYVFCQEAGYWNEWNGTEWERIYEPPMPSGIFAGIGTRDLNVLGKMAIRVLMNYKNVRFEPSFEKPAEHIRVKQTVLKY